MVIRYPASLDTTVNLPTVVDAFTPVTGATFNRLRDTILAIEKELGVKPSGTQTTVGARLTTLESLVNNLQPIELVQDLSGTLTHPLVVGLQGRPISANVPSTGQVLTWNGIVWAPESTQIVTYTTTLQPPTTLVELNQVVFDPLFTATYSQTPITATIIDNQGNPAQNVFTAPAPSVPPNSFVYPQSYQFSTYPSNNPNSVLFTLTSNDGAANAFSTTTITWTQRVYFGVGPTGGSTASFIQALANNPLSQAGTMIFTVNAGVSQAIYFSYRTAYGTADFFVDGWEGGFNLVSTTIPVTNAHGFTENYTLYQSAQTNLGQTTVNVFFSNNINSIIDNFPSTPSSQTALLPMGGDISGTTSASTVIGLQARSVSATAPTTGQMLGWNGSTWIPTNNLLANIVSITGNYLAPTTTQTILVGTLSAPITVTLPATPVAGQTITVKDFNGSAAAHAISISGNGNNIDGSSAPFILSANFESIELIFGTISWGII